MLRHPASWPTLWLMTDERQGEALWGALARLPRGSGVVFRHHRSTVDERGAVRADVERIARRRGLVVAVEVEQPLHLILFGRNQSRQRRAAAPWIARVHTQREAVAARRTGAAAIFVSPIFPTRTHPGERPLGPLRAARIAHAARLPAIALGGMTARRFDRMKRLGLVGWAAIDALTPLDQKRKAVPT